MPILALLQAEYFKKVGADEACLTDLSVVSQQWVPILSLLIFTFYFLPSNLNVKLLLKYGIYGVLQVRRIKLSKRIMINKTPK
jgi:hypothetical protein